MLGETENLFQLMTLGFASTTVLASAAGMWWHGRARRLKREMALNLAALETLNEGFYRSSFDGRQLYANAALARLNGYRTGEEQIAAVNDIATEWYVDPTRREEFIALLNREGSITNFVSQVYRHATRERIWIREDARIVFDPETGEPIHYEGTVRDISEEIRHRELQKRLSRLAGNLPGGLFHLVRHADGSFTTPYVSASFLRLFGFPENATIGDPTKFVDKIHEQDIDAYLQALAESGRKLQPLDLRIRVHDLAGKLRWFHITASVERNDEGSIAWYGYVNDITAHKEAELRMEQLAYYDQLTGLPKRSVLEDRLISAIAACNRRQEHAALLFIDLDNFKALNDTHGHETGDQLLKQVAQRLSGLVRASDIVSRYGGDEFVLLIDNLGKDQTDARAKASTFAAKALKAFGDPFPLDKVEHLCSPSIGIAMIGTDMPSADAVIKSADTAMYGAKKKGRNTFVFHEGRSGKTGGKADDLGEEMPSAIENGEFELLLQPQMDDRGRLAGAEAFLRWNHPVLGLLSPQEFVPVAERNGCIVALNNWVIRTAINILADWKENPGYANLSLAVNVSVQQFSADSFASELERMLFEAGIERHLLTIELTEIVMNRNLERVSEQMNEIKKTGVRFSLDDFGTGSSSLSNLNRLPFDEVKIDGSFVSSIESEAKNRSLIEGILGIAAALNLDTVAEHVTSGFQEKYLREKGCKRFQGYFYHPPIGREAFEELAAKSTLRPRLSVAS